MPSPALSGILFGVSLVIARFILEDPLSLSIIPPSLKCCAFSEDDGNPEVAGFPCSLFSASAATFGD